MTIQQRSSSNASSRSGYNHAKRSTLIWSSGCSDLVYILGCYVLHCFDQCCHVVLGIVAMLIALPCVVASWWTNGVNGISLPSLVGISQRIPIVGRYLMSIVIISKAPFSFSVMPCVESCFVSNDGDNLCCDVRVSVEDKPYFRDPLGRYIKEQEGSIGHELILLFALVSFQYSGRCNYNSRGIYLRAVYGIANWKSKLQSVPRICNNSACNLRRRSSMSRICLTDLWYNIAVYLWIIG